jgi:hypothetical protein
MNKPYIVFEVHNPEESQIIQHFLFENGYCLYLGYNCCEIKYTNTEVIYADMDKKYLSFSDRDFFNNYHFNYTSFKKIIFGINDLNLVKNIFKTGREIDVNYEPKQLSFE